MGSFDKVDDMRVVSWNIQHLEQYDRTNSAEFALAQMLEMQKPDVLLLQEVDIDKARTNKADQLAEIRASLDALDSKFQETKLIPKEDGKYGIGIVSKIPVVEWHSIELPRSPIGRRLTFEFGGESETFFVHDHPRAALAAILDNGFCVVNTHLSFMPVAAQMQMIRVVIWAKKLARKHNVKLIIGGDFNFVGTGWLKLFGLRESVVGNTFPAWNPEKQIDHILIDSQASFSTSAIGAQGPISDHRWISIDI